MHAAVACITSDFAVERRVRGTVPSLVSESSCRKTRMSSHIVAGVSIIQLYRWIIIETHAAVEMA